MNMNMNMNSEYFPGPKDKKYIFKCKEGKYERYCANSKLN